MDYPDLDLIKRLTHKLLAYSISSFKPGEVLDLINHQREYIRILKNEVSELKQRIPFPRKPDERCFLVTVKQRDCMQPRLYKVYGTEEPTYQRLKELGANIHPPRMDTYTIDEVSSELASAVGATWLRD